jgi:hypothetical protein
MPVEHGVEFDQHFTDCLYFNSTFDQGLAINKMTSRVSIYR